MTALPSTLSPDAFARRMGKVMTWVTSSFKPKPDAVMALHGLRLARAVRHANARGVMATVQEGGVALAMTPYTLSLQGDVKPGTEVPADVLSVLRALDGTLSGWTLTCGGEELFRGLIGSSVWEVTSRWGRLKLEGRLPTTVAALVGLFAPGGTATVRLERLTTDHGSADIYAAGHKQENFALKRRLLENPIVRQVMRAIERALMAPHMPPVPDALREAAASYRRTGLWVVPGMLPVEQVLSLQEIMDSHDAAETDISFGARDFNEGRKVVSWYDLDGKEDQVTAIAHDSAIESTASAVTGVPQRMVRHLMKRVRADEARGAEGMLTNELWHADSTGLHGVRLLAYLSPVPQASLGAFQYLKGSHRRPRGEEHGITSFCGMPGDTAIVDVTGQHRAARPTQGVRDTMQMLFVSPLTDVMNHLLYYPTYVKDAAKQRP